MRTEIYLDSNATTSVLPAAIAAAVDAMAQCFGNPSSSHGAGLRAKAVLDGARARATRLLGVGSGRLMFNSGATEGIQTAVLSALRALRERQSRGEATGDLLVYGATEHKAVPQSLDHWNRLLGLNLTLHALPVDGEGRHDLAALRALAPRAALVCTMAANNETGVISDLAGIEAVLADTASAAYWLVDCVQALGKLPLDLARTRIDYAPFSGHKLYAPKGIGMLYVRDGAPFTPLIMGGGQEAGLRSGTENMAGIAALGAVLAALEQGGTFRSHAELAGFRARLADSLCAALPGIVFNHGFAASLPTTLNFSVPGVASRALMDVFDAAGVRVSSGSACSAKAAAPSYVLVAMGVPDWRASGAIRMSFGPLTDAATIAAACARIARCGAALRSGGLLPLDGAPAVHDAAEAAHDGAEASRQPGATLPAPDASAPPADDAMRLAPAALDAFLQAHPDARLIDVRERYECAATVTPAPGGRPAISVPLGQLPGWLAQWRGEAQVPLVFYCRSGNRSLKAAQYLRGLGHQQAWSLDGGLALASPAIDA
ncbi:aminotransferase class V-fold PLP-dependent enzyme [Rugamonas apoptosis]|uniref:cysteine desulfurase n=1 Tax=Rugamonas apoptosis TaxID=2758570 RepID=A0A7W2F5R7_9BURK|nr:aminotransferase class V-fold PLP-dependent enzyme [Rugamonas apoptosis]MBA5685640.1 aminotransferase class V-fold PLP-dependent enzyme [Rugamonas apoptosis]